MHNADLNEGVRWQLQLQMSLTHIEEGRESGIRGSPIIASRSRHCLAVVLQQLETASHARAMTTTSSAMRQTTPQVSRLHNARHASVYTPGYLVEPLHRSDLPAQHYNQL